VEVIYGFGNPHLVEKDSAHIVIIVLAGVKDDFRNGVMFFGFWIPVVGDDGPADHGGLAELGACPDDGEDFHVRFFGGHM
jgi:hypothetical protein